MVVNFSDGGIRNAAIRDALLFMVCKDNLPLSTPDNPGFQHFCKTTVPLWKPPSRTTLTSDMELKYEEVSAFVRAELSKVPSVCITMDCWTESHQTNSFLGVTAHYADGENMRTVVLGVDNLTESHTGEYLKECVLNFLENWNIKKKQVALAVTDNAANIVLAAKLAFGEDKRIGCFAHLLNLIPSECMFPKKDRNTNEKIEHVPGLIELIKKVRNIATLSHRSQRFADEIKSIQRDKNIPEGLLKRLKIDVITRWGSTYEMLISFLDLRPVVKVAALSFEEIDLNDFPSGDEVANLMAIKELLFPIYAATTEISTEKTTSASKIIPIVKLIDEV